MNKLIYLPIELLNLRHNYKYDIYLPELDISTQQQQQPFFPPPLPITFPTKLTIRLYTNTANNNNLYPISAFVLIQQPLYCQSQFNSTLPNYYNSSHPPIQDLVQPIFISSPPISPISLSSPITPIAIPVIRIDSNKLVPFGGVPLSDLYTKKFQQQEFQQRTHQKHNCPIQGKQTKHSMLATFPLYNTPISPESKGNVLKPGKDNDQNINPGNNKSESPLLHLSNSKTTSSSSSQSTSSSDVIIQI